MDKEEHREKEFSASRTLEKIKKFSYKDEDKNWEIGS
jgi:hypothetical protein